MYVCNYTRHHKLRHIAKEMSYFLMIICKKKQSVQVITSYHIYRCPIDAGNDVNYRLCIVAQMH